MSQWIFSAFDWQQFQELESRIGSVRDVSDFEGVDIEGLDGFLEEFVEGTNPQVICNALVNQFCCSGSHVAVIESGMPAVIKYVAKMKDSEDVEMVMAELVAGGKNIEKWFKTEAGLVGLLTVSETRMLADFLLSRMAEEPPKEKSLLGAVGSFLSRTDVRRSDLEDLVEILGIAVEGGFGVAAFTDSSFSAPNQKESSESLSI